MRPPCTSPSAGGRSFAAAYSAAGRPRTRTRRARRRVPFEEDSDDEAETRTPRRGGASSSSSSSSDAGGARAARTRGRAAPSRTTSISCARGGEARARRSQLPRASTTKEKARSRWTRPAQRRARRFFRGARSKRSLESDGARGRAESETTASGSTKGQLIETGFLDWQNLLLAVGTEKRKARTHRSFIVASRRGAGRSVLYRPTQTTRDMVSFNRLLLVIKQTAFDAYKAQEAIATAAGQAVFDPARMQSLARRHDTHMYQVDTLVPIRPRSRGERRSLRTFPVVSLRPGSLAFNPDTPRRLSTPLLTPFNSAPTSHFVRNDPRVSGRSDHDAPARHGGHVHDERDALGDHARARARRGPGRRARRRRHDAHRVASHRGRHSAPR